MSISRLFLPLLAFSLLASCSDWSWNKLNPLYIQSSLDQQYTPVLKTLPDGRDISGYKIPGKESTYVNTGTISETSSDILTGTSTGIPNQVRSPYSPYKLLDSTGLKSGDLAKDPDSMKVFRIP